jgi:hypothetical protein
MSEPSIRMLEKKQTYGLTTYMSVDLHAGQVNATI